MSGIQASTGLITGLPIEETVDQLMAVAGRRRDLVSNRNRDLQAELAALDQVGSLLLGLQFSSNQLGQSSIYSATSVSSSNSQAVAATRITGGNPVPGSYQVTPLQLASAHSLSSGALAQGDSLPSTGTLSIGFGGHVDQSVALSELNSGAGFQAGSIRITDRSGEFATIDLRTARTIDDVLTAINSDTSIDVTATVDGDRLVLTDNNGATGNLRVSEVGTGTTAASLGLGGINTAADSVTGSDIYSLHAGTRLSRLNDGNGVLLRDEVDDIEVALADGTTLSIDIGDATTLGGVIDAINAADDTKLSAAISSDGRRLELTDLTSGSVTFAVTSIGTGSAAEDLGLTTTASSGVITGSRLIGGLSDTLASSLNGGQGLGTLGQITLTDRSGTSDTVDLAGAETLRDIITAINGSSAQITASINNSRDGIVLTDTSGGSGNLTIASADANNSAEALGIVIDDTSSTIDSGSLRRQIVSESTRLATLNGGRGVQLGSIRITDSAGTSTAINLNTVGSPAQTIGDVIDAINAAGVQVEARINDTGDGILLIDKAGGTESLTVAEVAGRTTAADLQLLGASSASNEAGEQTIDGRTRIEVDLSQLAAGTSNIPLSGLRGGLGISLGIFSITDAAGTEAIVDLGEAGSEAFTVADVIEKINTAATAAGAGVTATLNSSGTGIRLNDSSGGSAKLTVTDLGSGTAAAELGIAGEGVTSSGSQVIRGSSIFSAAQSSDSGIEALAARINSRNLGIRAQSVFDGAGFRLVLSSATSGRANQLLVRSSIDGFNFSEISEGRDALAQLGGAGGIIASSKTNDFENVIPGIRFTAAQATGQAVTVKVAADNNPVVNAAKSFVEAFNSLRTTIGALADFDPESLTTGILFGRSEIVRIESDLARILSGRVTGAGPITSLESLGFSLNDKGQLELDEAKLRDTYAAQPNDVQRFFTTESNGVVARINSTVTKLAGEEKSLLAIRSDSLLRNIETNTTRIEFMNDQLGRQRDRLLLDFYRLEETIARVQGNLSAVESIVGLEPLSFARN